MFGETTESHPSEQQLTIDLRLYGLEAIFRACYAFTDRCYLFLRDAGQSQITAVFRKRQSPKTLEALMEEFANELINQHLRVQLSAETRVIREMIVAQAFAEADL